MTPPLSNFASNDICQFGKDGVADGVSPTYYKQRRLTKGKSAAAEAKPARKARTPCRIIDVLGVATGRNHLRLAQLSKALGEGRLAQTDMPSKLADGHLIAPGV